MKRNLSIDVILPFHEMNQYCIESIKSVLSSTINVRLILVNDSNLSNNQVIKLIPDRKQVSIYKTDGFTGYGNSLHVGSKEISSEVAALMNSDDLIHPERFRLQIENLGDNDLSFTKLIKFGGSKLKNMQKLGIEPKSTYDTSYLLLGSYGSNASWLFRTNWWHKNAFFDRFDFLDWRIALNNFLNTKVTYLPKALYYYRQHNQQATRYRRNDIDIVYKSWSNFAKNINIETYDFNLFKFLSMPWEIHDTPKREFLEKFVVEANNNIFHNQARQYFNYLIRRRILVEVRKNHSPAYILENLGKLMWASIEITSEAPWSITNKANRIQ